MPLKLGVQRNGDAGGPTAVADYETWLGRPVNLPQIFAWGGNTAPNDWDSLMGGNGQITVGGQWSVWKAADPTNRRLAYTVGMFPDTGYNLADGAAGSYNAHWTLLGQRLVDAGLADTILRIGHEFNGSWYPWAAAPLTALPNRATDFAAYWQQIVTTLRAVAGQAFEFDWCPTVGTPDFDQVNSEGFKAERAYPGDAYVDYIGIDVYDQSFATYPASGAVTSGQQDTVWNSEIYGHLRGLAYWSSFATTHAKRLSIPEWGVAVNTNHFGDDNPRFIARMYDFMRATTVAYASYYDVHDPADFQLSLGTQATDRPWLPSALPDSAAVFARLFTTSQRTRYRDAVQVDSPVAWWRLDEANGTVAADTLGVNPGSYVGAPVVADTPLTRFDTGYAASFDNSTMQYVEVPSSATLNPASLTVECIIQATSWNGNNRIVQKGASDNQYRLLRESGLLVWNVAGHTNVAVALTDTNPHHIAGTYDAATGLAVLYIDGVEVGRNAGTPGSAGTTTDALRIAQKSGGSTANDGFNGTVDEVALYSTALTPARVAAHAAAAGISAAPAFVSASTRALRRALPRPARGRVFLVPPAPAAAGAPARVPTWTRARSRWLPRVRRGVVAGPTWAPVVYGTGMAVGVGAGGRVSTRGLKPRRGLTFRLPPAVVAAGAPAVPPEQVQATRRQPVRPARRGQHFEPPWPQAAQQAPVVPTFTRATRRPVPSLPRRGGFTEPPWPQGPQTLWLPEPTSLAGPRPRFAARPRRGEFIEPVWPQVAVGAAPAVPPPPVQAIRRAAPRPVRRGQYTQPPWTQGPQTIWVPGPVQAIRRALPKPVRRGRLFDPPWPQVLAPAAPVTVRATPRRLIRLPRGNFYEPVWPQGPQTVWRPDVARATRRAPSTPPRRGQYLEPPWPIFLPPPPQPAVATRRPPGRPRRARFFQPPWPQGPVTTWRPDPISPAGVRPRWPVYRLRRGRFHEPVWAQGQQFFPNRWHEGGGSGTGILEGAGSGVGLVEAGGSGVGVMEPTGGV